MLHCVNLIEQGKLTYRKVVEERKHICVATLFRKYVNILEYSITVLLKYLQYDFYW